jgi:hypothetical protein
MFSYQYHIVRLTLSVQTFILCILREIIDILCCSSTHFRLFAPADRVNYLPHSSSFLRPPLYPYRGARVCILITGPHSRRERWPSGRVNHHLREQKAESRFRQPARVNGTKQMATSGLAGSARAGSFLCLCILHVCRSSNSTALN